MENEVKLNAGQMTRSQKRRMQRKRAKLKAEADTVVDEVVHPVDSLAEKRKKLREWLKYKQERRSGKKQEILVPAPVPGELSAEELQQHQRKMQKLVERKGRSALLDELGVKDKQTKVELAKAMVEGNTDVMNQIMKKVHDPTQDPDLDK